MKKQSVRYVAEENLALGSPFASGKNQLTSEQPWDKGPQHIVTCALHSQAYPCSPVESGRPTRDTIWRHSWLSRGFQAVQAGKFRWHCKCKNGPVWLQSGLKETPPVVHKIACNYNNKNGCKKTRNSATHGSLWEYLPCLLMVIAVLLMLSHSFPAFYRA